MSAGHPNIGRGHRDRYWPYRSIISIRGVAGPGISISLTPGHL